MRKERRNKKGEIITQGDEHTFFAVYNFHDDDELICVGSARECAEYLGYAAPQSFISSVSHAIERHPERQGTILLGWPVKYIVKKYRDDEEEE